jgi:hypothetical protein
MRNSIRGAARAPETHNSELTAAQARELLGALRQHPAPYEPARKTVATRLTNLGLLEVASGNGFRLSAAGLDAAARLQAQAIIDETNATKLERRAAAVQSGVKGPPPGWPFPISAHRWD